jgi:diguanylate cyclase (GGDEF)-like protein
MQFRKLNHYWSRILIAIAVLAGIILAISAILGLYTPPRDAVQFNSGIKIYRGGSYLMEGDLPFLMSANDQGGFIPGSYRIDASFTLSTAVPRSPVLVFPFIGGNSFSVRLNGIELGSRGDPVAGASSIWNSALFFPASSDTLRQTNQVEVEIKGLYEAGILKAPYLIDAVSHRGRLFALALFTNYAAWILFGMGTVVGLIMMATALPSLSRIDGNFLVGLGCMVAGILFLDYAQIQYLPISFLSFDRIIVALRHVYFMLFVFTVLALINKRAGFFEYGFSVIQLLCALAILIIPSDLPSLKRLYTYTYLSAVPLLPYLLYLLIRYPKRNRNFSILLFGALVAFFSAALDAYDMVFATSNPFISHYGFSILLFCSVAIIIRIMLNQYRSLLTEQRRSLAFREESMRDALTGAYNRKVLPVIDRQLLKDFSVIFVDLDDFKSVNDSFGHAAGDEVLKHLAEAMRVHLRAKDYVVRNGGDEFIAVLPDCPVEKAADLARRLAATAASARISWGDASSIAYTASIGVAGAISATPLLQRDLMAVISRADSEAYRAKRAGKNRVCVERRG